MRPAGKGPLEFALFRLSDLPGRRMRPSAKAQRTRHPVVIAGAGPIGMTAALALARHGVRSVLLDRKETFNDGSRAICIARPSMHILERIGTVAPFLAKALGWRFGRSYYQRQADLPPGDAASRRAKNICRCTICSSSTSRNICTTPSQPADLIDMRWQSEVAAHRQQRRRRRARHRDA